MNQHTGLMQDMAEQIFRNNQIEHNLYKKYNVKKGLRDENNVGIVVGLTKICDVHGYEIVDGKKVADEGQLTYRGISIENFVKGFQADGRKGFEEVAYLLLCGKLPNEEEIVSFSQLLQSNYNLPEGFMETMILRIPSKDIMNKIQRSLLVLYSYDDQPEESSIENSLRQSISLIAKMPAIIAYGYQAKNHYFNNQSLYIHSPKPEYGIAQNILHMIRPTNEFTEKEAEVLDLCLVLHADHGGGNNSTFTLNVISSTGTDIYSALAAAAGSLKGPKHGGANIMVLQMMEDIKAHVDDWSDDEELKSYLLKIFQKQAFDRTGLIYGLGHAIYTLSDPRANLLKEKAYELAVEKGSAKVKEFMLYHKIEVLTKEIFAEHKPGVSVAANVDLYSGFVYDILNIPREIYTPLFAAARMAGWCAHRLENIVVEKKIIRPAYQDVCEKAEYIPLNAR